MRLKDIHIVGDGRAYHFVRIRSDGEPLDEMVINTDGAGIILRIEIRQNERGDCAFSATGELEYCTGWESESQAQEASVWSKHFPQPTTLGRQGAEFAETIFADLATKITDTYLRHLLYAFPAQASKIVFDARLYRVYIPPEISPTAAELEELPAVEEAKSRWQRALAWASAFAHHRPIIALSAAALFLVLSLLLVWQLLTRQGLGNDPSKWPQLTKEQIELYSKIPENEAHAYRLRNFAEVVNGETLPLLKLSKRTFASLITDYTRIKGGISVRGGASEVKVLTSYDSFLDDIYNDSPEQQLRKFHSSVYLNPELTSFTKARLLNRLYRFNLVRVLSGYSPNPFFYAYDYVERQLNKAELTDYLLRIMAIAPDSEVAAEAHLIFADLTEIQQRLVQLLFFDTKITTLCFESESEKNSVERTVCTIARRYKPWVLSTEYDSRKQFQEFKLQNLSHGLSNNRTSYRRNDMLMEKTASLLGILENYGNFAEFRASVLAIRPHDNYGEFVYAPAYRRIISSKEWLTQDQTRIPKIPQYEMHSAELVTQLKYYRREQENALLEIESFRKMRQYLFGREYEEQMAKVTERANRLSPKRP